LQKKAHHGLEQTYSQDWDDPAPAGSGAIESFHLGRLVLTCCGAGFSDLDESVAAAVAR
jgi:hypothetical protein